MPAGSLESTEVPTSTIHSIEVLKGAACGADDCPMISIRLKPGETLSKQAYRRRTP
jgi:hypothetical protein